MRISTRLIENALTTYLRLGATFVAGVLFTWYVIGRVGLVGFGMIALAGSGLGVTVALEAAVTPSVMRRLARALASGRPGRLDRTVATAFALCGRLALALLVVFAGVAAAAAAGVFNTPAGADGLPAALALLFLAEAVLAASAMVLAPFHQALLAAQRVGLDNLQMLLSRLVVLAAAFLAFDGLAADAGLAVRIEAFAGVRVALALLVHAAFAGVACACVPGLRLRRAARDARERRLLAATILHTAQVTLHANLTIHAMSLLVNLFFGLTWNGMWQIVVQIGGHVRIVADAALRGISPLAAHLHARGRTKEIAYLMARAVRYQLAIALPVAALYALFLPPILGLWVGGRLGDDPGLRAAGLDVPTALGLIALAGSLNMLAEAARAATRGVERMLYGMGYVRDYAWFSKWACGATLAGATAVMALTASPVWALLPLAVMHVVYFDVLVPRVAALRAGLPVSRIVLGALPRPLVLTALLVLPALAVRPSVTTLTVGGLLLLLGGIAAVYLPMLFAVGFDRAERGRLLEIVRSGARRLPGRG